MRSVARVWGAAILAAVVCSGIALGAVWARPAVGEPIYSVDEVVAGLRHHPQTLVGRTIRVRGMVVRTYSVCGPLLQQCGASSYMLVEYPVYRIVVPVPLLPLHPEVDSLLTDLRRLPGLGRWLSSPQPVLGTAVLRVALRSVPRSDLCVGRSCYEAIVPDADST